METVKNILDFLNPTKYQKQAL